MFLCLPGLKPLDRIWWVARRMETTFGIFTCLHLKKSFLTSKRPEAATFFPVIDVFLGVDKVTVL